MNGSSESHPRDRLAAAYFPDGSSGDPNRCDAGPVRCVGAAQTRVLRLLVPSSSRLTVRLVASVIRTTPSLPAVAGASYTFDFAISRDAAPAAPAVLASLPLLANADGAYVLAAVPGPAGSDWVDFTFTGLGGEEYDVTASVQVFGTRVR